jgi:hypothetical protein
VYSSSLFSGPIDIVSLAFSPDVTDTYSADVTIRLTTTSVAIGSLSSTLDSNFVTPLTTVFANATFSQAVVGGSETFSLVFDFSTTPFSYNPADGNLLLDILIDSKTYSGFGVSRSGGGTVYSRVQG